MCHERWFRRERRDERFEEEVRFLLDREKERPKPPTPVVERESDRDTRAEPEPEKAPVVSR
jgi:hypothetical protein